MKYVIKQDGFTLIETMVAMVVFTIGILALFGMQSAAIKENLVANSITTGSARAAARVEELIALNYADDEISDEADYKDCSFFSDPDWWQNVPADQRDEFSGETAGQPDYFVYWAVSKDCTLVKEGDVGLDNNSPYRPKHLFIAVTRDKYGTKDNLIDDEVTAEFSYIKQNSNY